MFSNDFSDFSCYIFMNSALLRSKLPGNVEYHIIYTLNQKKMFRESGFQGGGAVVTLFHPKVPEMPHPLPTMVIFF